MIGITALAFFLAGAAQAQSLHDFAYGIPLSTSGDEPFFQVAVPAQVFQGAARSGAADFRVFNADGAIVPFAYLPSPVAGRERRPPVELPLFPLRADRAQTDLSGMTVSVTSGAAGTTFNLSTRDGKAVDGEQVVGYVLDASMLDEPMAALTLKWSAPPRGFSTRVRVEAGDDLASWRTLVADAPLLDLEYSGRHLTRNRIELAKTQAKYLRLSWPSGTPGLELTSAQIEYAQRVVEPPRQWVEATGIAGADRPGDYEFDLQAAYPIDRIAIDLPELNTVLPALVFARAGMDDAWRVVASGVFYRLRQGDGEVTSPPVAVDTPGLRYWRLRPDPDSGGLGAAMPRLRGGWTAPQLVFAARGAAPFTIAYGNANVTPSALPVATLVPGYGTASAPAIGIAMAQPGAPVTIGGPQRLHKAIDGKRLLLWSMLLLGVAILAWMAWRLSRQLELSTASDRSDASLRKDEAPGLDSRH
jgi:hypothetical protein